MAQATDSNTTIPSRFLGVIYASIAVPETLWPDDLDGRHALLILTEHRIKTLESIFDFSAGADPEERDALVIQRQRLEVEIDAIEEVA